MARAAMAGTNRSVNTMDDTMDDSDRAGIIHICMSILYILVMNTHSYIV